MSGTSHGVKVLKILPCQGPENLQNCQLCKYQVYLAPGSWPDLGAGGVIIVPRAQLSETPKIIELPKSSSWPGNWLDAVTSTISDAATQAASSVSSAVNAAVNGACGVNSMTGAACQAAKQVASGDFEGALSTVGGAIGSAASAVGGGIAYAADQTLQGLKMLYCWEVSFSVEDIVMGIGNFMSWMMAPINAIMDGIFSALGITLPALPVDFGWLTGLLDDLISLPEFNWDLDFLLIANFPRIDYLLDLLMTLPSIEIPQFCGGAHMALELKEDVEKCRAKK